jgi:multidrug efflux system outer membrane protein
MRAGYLVWPVAALTLAGCINLGPDYERPEVETPEAYIGQDIQEETLANLQWWDVFNDPALQALITESIGQNRDLRLAVARVNEARAQLGISFADQFPTVDGAAGFNRGNLAEQILPDGARNRPERLCSRARKASAQS